MTPVAIIERAMADGVSLALSAAGTIKATGETATVNRWLPLIREHKPGIVLALSSASATAYRWLIHYAKRNPVEVACSPPATHAEILAVYPAAIAAEPFEPIRRQPGARLTAGDEAAVRAWLARIEETDAAIIGEVLRQCRTDADARDYFMRRTNDGEQSALDRAAM